MANGVRCDTCGQEVDHLSEVWVCGLETHVCERCLGATHTHEVWVKLPDGSRLVAGRAWTMEQAQYIKAQLVTCAKKARWRYVYTIRAVAPRLVV